MLQSGYMRDSVLYGNIITHYKVRGSKLLFYDAHYVHHALHIVFSKFPLLILNNLE